jgi:UDP-N-acetylglucosamine 4,6-dehydratase/5-epimerase
MTKKNIENALKKELKNKTILITGGAGSLGSALAKKLLEFDITSVRVLDHNEHSLFQLKRSLSDSRLRLLLGNILDKDRVDLATNNVDIILHTAALKNIEITEYNPIDTIDVNVNGTVNMIKSAIKNKPKKFINISTDKVADSSTLYGTTKQLGERLISWSGPHILTTNFATIRLGNIIETKGNVFEVWNEQLKKNISLSITHPKMQRYFFHMDEATDFILSCLSNMKTGDIYIPKMKSYKITELASKISKKQKIIGLRPGEKLEEILLTQDEKQIAIEKNNMWIIKHNF